MRYIALISCFFIVQVCNSQIALDDPLLADDLEAQKRWVDSVYTSMSLKERIGQLFMVQAFSRPEQQNANAIVKLIKEQHIGGVIFSNGSPDLQAKLNNDLQYASKLPLLVGMDAEWGLSMRLDSSYAFPWNMTLGAIENTKLIEKTGYHIGEHCKRLGVHFNFAPVVDINTNPNNPIIGNRSFGEDRDNVTIKASAFMKGMQEAGVLANAKHFPGHGDTKDDSHLTLPTIQFSEQRIDSVELYPYKQLIKEGLSSVMVAHLNVPSLEAQEGLPSSLSKHIVTDILKERLNFKGLIFTDALTMKGAANFNETGAIDLAAFMAGNDVLLMSEDVSKGSAKIMSAYQSGVISEARLAHSVKKILKAKFKVGLNNYEPVGLYNLHEDLNRLKDDLLYSNLMEHAITVLKNDLELLPLKDLERKTIAYIKLGDDSGDEFLRELKKYTKVTEVKATELNELIGKLQNYNLVIIGFHKSNDNPWKSYKFNSKELVWIDEIAKTNRVLLDVFARPYALADLKSIENIEAIVMSYQNSTIAQQQSAQLLFGAIGAKGKLPVSIGNYFNVNHGITFNAIQRLGYTLPEHVGMDSKRLSKLDSVANHAVKEGMTPGIQLLVARKGKVVYNKNFGKHTYQGRKEVEFEDLYDVASLTKILSTLPLLMEMEEQGIFSLNNSLKVLMPEYQFSNKGNITPKQMLSHYARLKPWIPFYTATLDSVTKKPSKDYYRTKKSDEFSIKIAENLFLRNDYEDSIQKIILESEPLSSLRYRYSDLPYYILKAYIERHYGKGLDALVQDHFYKSLGANYTTYNPREKFGLNQIVPTEEDTYYRYQTVHGYVHDMGAAMQGGVGGHAGIFSNANDVAKIMQMYLQGGYYGGKRYLKEETVNKFNFCYYCRNNNRRGIGFDKPQLGEAGPTCGCLSMKSFGHSGFTGTYAWADPDEEIVYVFLANRTYPNAEENRLLRENIRTDIQRLIYEAIEEKPESSMDLVNVKNP